MKYLMIYWIWVDDTISIPYKKFHSYDFIKVIWMRFLIQISISVLKKKIVEKLMSFERQQELCWKLLYQNSFYMFIKMLDEFKKKLSPK
jgi:hypothetical protein